MNAPLIWLNEEALRITHPVFQAAPAHTKAMYIWDDNYFRQANYSLKRLIFIYETLCELPVDVIQGTTLNVIRECAPSTLYVPSTNNPLIVSIIEALKAVAQIDLIQEEAFAVIKSPSDFSRFFPYWSKAEKTVFQQNGGAHAERN